MTADLIARLFASGTPPELVAEVAMALSRLEAERDAAETADRRSAAAIKQKRYRDRLRAREVTNGNDVTGEGNEVTEKVTRYADVTEPPTPDKKPPDPKKLTPTPCVQDAPACEAEPELPSPMQVLIAWLSIEAVISAATAKRWKGKPPPQGVNAEQWRGFLDHRKAMRHTLTDRGYQLLLAKLAKHATADWPPGRIIDLIVERGWRSFEPDWLPKANDQNGFHRNRPGRIAADQHPGGRTGAAADAVFGGGPVP